MASVFDKISRLFLGQADESSGRAVQDDVFKRNADDINLIVRKLAGTIGNSQKLSDKTLLVLTGDALELNRLKNDDFLDELKNSLASNLGDVFKAIKVERLSSEHAEASRLKDGLSIMIEQPLAEAAGNAACICALPGYGSLAQTECRIGKEGKYNIGIGETATLQNGTIRRNHIAISSSPDDPQYDKNKYVSREHAHIVFSREEGFMLYVEMNGTRIKGKRTRILRDDMTIDLANPMLPQKLIDGDIIELSKSVLLSFNITDH